MRQFIFPIFFIFFFIGSIAFGVICFTLHNHTIDFSALQQDVAAKPSRLIDCHGNEWGRFQLDKRKYVLLESLPEHLIQAFLVTEDRSFFQHPGISFRGIVRSVLVNFLKGKRMQGASTITQQLVRLKFLSCKKTFSRKIKEQIYAILVERQWSKEQILEAYLNNVYFGYGIYGVQAAAQRFWGIDVSCVNLEQAAVLASVMKSPRVYSPIHAPEAVLQRRNLILKLMYQCGMINQLDMDEGQLQPLRIKESDSVVVAPHAKEMIRILLEGIIGKDRLYTGGLTIQTTLDIDVQMSAQEAFVAHVAHLKKKINKNTDGGLITIDSQTGAIKALVGGFDYRISKLNRAVQAYRQMGSVFKLLVYSAALEQGLHFWDVELDEPFELTQGGSVWRPNNYNNKFIGPMTRAYALSHSNNIVTIKTLLQVGVDKVIDMAHRCGIVSYMPPYPSLALGCVDVNVLEVVGSFNVFANHGCYVQPHLVNWVKDEYGQKIYKSTVIKKQVVSSKIASQIMRVLTFGIKRLQSYWPESSLGVQAMGKTGTNNDFRTCWFCGATPELTTAIYIGCDDNTSLGNQVFGSKTAYPIWFKMHQKIAKTKTNFYYDPQLHDVFVNWITGQVSSDRDSLEVVPLLV